MHPPRRLAGSHGVDRTRGLVKVRDGGLKKCPNGTAIAQRDPLTKTFRPIYRDLCPHKKHFQGTGFCTRLVGSHGVDRKGNGLIHRLKRSSRFGGLPARCMRGLCVCFAVVPDQCITAKCQCAISNDEDMRRKHLKKRRNAATCFGELPLVT